MSSIDLSWLKNIKTEVKQFLEKMSENDFSYFRYSYSGDLFNQSKKWGLGNLVFAVKILHATGLLYEIEAAKKENLFKAIIRFSNSEGQIYDPLITTYGILDRINHLLNKNTPNVEHHRRAETRQAFAALHSAAVPRNKGISTILLVAPSSSSIMP